MRLSTFMTFKGVITLSFGIGFLLIPGLLWSLYGLGLNPAGEFVGRLLGAGFVLIGLLLLLARNLHDRAALLAIVTAFLIGDLLALVASFAGQVSGVTNWFGWSIVGLYLLFPVGFGYFLFIKPRDAWQT